ncbi:MAG: hypothetical protein KAG96_06975 [Ichthyobacteriaceae bacterium]|nr:hypothetical protein [Ichthyobacteriaceae bacterium]
MKKITLFLLTIISLSAKAQTTTASIGFDPKMFFIGPYYNDTDASINVTATLGRQFFNNKLEAGVSLEYADINYLESTIYVAYVTPSLKYKKHEINALIGFDFGKIRRHDIYSYAKDTYYNSIISNTSAYTISLRYFYGKHGIQLNYDIRNRGDLQDMYDMGRTETRRTNGTISYIFRF